MDGVVGKGSCKRHLTRVCAYVCVGVCVCVWVGRTREEVYPTRKILRLDKVSGGRNFGKSLWMTPSPSSNFRNCVGGAGECSNSDVWRGRKRSKRERYVCGIRDTRSV